MDSPVVIRGRQSDAGLKLSADRKVTPKSSYQQSRRRWIPEILNGFGLTAGASCPGQTEVCAEACYAKRSEQSSGVSELVGHNLALLRAANFVGKVALIDEMMDRFLREAMRREVRVVDMIFRIHWDGDFFSTEYARAWAEVIRFYPEIRFWAYTRSFTDEVNVLPYLVDIPNLSLYLSIDMDNYKLGLRRLDEYGELVRPSWFGETEEEGLMMAGDREAVVCPENAKILPLVSRGRGACVRCQLCPNSEADIIFMKVKPHRPRVEKLGIDIFNHTSTRVCEHCGKPFEIAVKRGPPQKYCDKYCRWDASRARK